MSKHLIAQAKACKSQSNNLNNLEQHCVKFNKIKYEIMKELRTK